MTDETLTPGELDRRYRAMHAQHGGHRCVYHAALRLIQETEDSREKAVLQVIADRARRAMGHGPCKGCPKAR